MEVGGFCVLMGEERRDWLKRRGRRRDVWLPDRSRGKVAHSCGIYKCLFYTRKGDLRQGRRRVSSKQWRISVQSSQINIDRLFPFSPLFSLCFFFLGSGTRMVMWGTLHPVEMCDPDRMLSETSELYPSWNHARETFSSFFKSCWCQSYCDFIVTGSQLLPQPCSPFTYFSSTAMRTEVWLWIYNS